MYVITGATGNTGKVLTEALLAKGQKVRVIGRSAERLQEFARKGAEPFVSAAGDATALTRAFTGARAVYALIPPDMTTQDFRAHQERVGDALATAIEKSAVLYVVSLSSIGANLREGAGPVSGLHSFEQKLNRIATINVLHLRPGYFMENLLMQVQLVQMMGLMGGPLRADLPVALIATRDIGQVAAEEFLQLRFSGQ